jgi:hypothetical protein
MNLPGFTAQVSLYRTSNRYRSCGSEGDGSPATQSIVAAYYPGQRTQERCSDCLEGCAKGSASCNALALATIWFPPAAAAAFAACATGAAICLGWCAAPFIGSCCPKVCGFPNPLEPGEGCCDENEQCVDRYDPNSRQGCCPSDQSVCSGKCCAKGDTCCGGSCCPSNFHCLDGFCSQYPARSLWPEDWKPPRPPDRPINYCRTGYEPCGGTCCPPGLQCCSVGGGRVACMTNCLH